MAIQTIKYIQQINKKNIDFRNESACLNNVFISRLYLYYKNTPKQKTQQK